MRSFFLSAATALALFAGNGGAAAPVTPASVLAEAPASAWVAPAPDDLLVMDLAGGKRVVIALAPDFAPVHVASIRTLARAHWYDGLWIERVQDNYVVQWGDPTEKKPLPAGVPADPPAEYERSAAGLALTEHPYRDTFADRTGFVSGWPVAEDGGQAWLTHCYGMVGVGRGNAPSTGSGAELYAIIGHAPRALDRNIALVGRVLTGIEGMTALPRGSEAMGFYKTEGERLPILSARLASDLPEAQRPHVRVLDTASPAFAAWVKVRANRKDDFYVRPAGAIDLCSVMPPVKEGD
ncbi:peptidylprolyl isomerase [Sphingomonas sp. AP4-R1]|uniref:peptidylprolyl isomerase n=1 Tax=Sphingomonas sp. AP4-R1 TaxID=2735134 RepID=UPI001493D586|nr:peptidylprolyl isomerase [Sphingomonas sp. AP4-R1]QJU60331.1 peptidylprolyl isomerase [Sphingomonas sp. AP4-R1]